MPHQALSLEQVADFLHLPPADVETLVRRNEIPVERKGGRLVFRRGVIEAWASERLLGLTDPELTRFHETVSAKAHDLSKTHAIIPELMRQAWIDPAVRAKTRSSVVRAMTGLAEATGLCLNPSHLLESLEEREALCSTALGGGLAMLHPRYHEPYLLEDSFIVLGRTVQPVPFGAPDGEKTDVFFLVCCQEDRIHLHVLARLCMLCSRTDLLADLRHAEDAEEMYCKLVAAEHEVVRNL